MQRGSAISAHTHTWEIKQTLLGTRVLPHKHRTQPALAALPPVNAEEQQQLENDDEAATDPDSDESRHSANTHSSGKLGSEAILAELEESIGDLQQEPPSPTAVVPVPAAAASAAPPRATAMELRSDGPTFEEVGSPSKIPRYRAPLPRAHPGATANISRAEVLPHDDELIDEYDEDTESLYPNSDDDYVEQDEVYKQKHHTESSSSYQLSSFKKNLDLQILKKSLFKHLMIRQPSRKSLGSQRWKLLSLSTLKDKKMMRANISPLNSSLIGSFVMQMVFNLKKVKIPKQSALKDVGKEGPDL